MQETDHLLNNRERYWPSEDWGLNEDGQHRQIRPCKPRRSPYLASRNKPRYALCREPVADRCPFEGPGALPQVYHLQFALSKYPERLSGYSKKPTGHREPIQ